MLIYIVRHGETRGNSSGILQGWTDEPLNDKGRELAVITAKALADVRFDVAISSPLSRAYETCRIMLAYNHQKLPEITTEPRLREMYFGAWENKHILKDNCEVDPERLNTLYNDPWNYVNDEGGESTVDVCRRTGEFYRELIAREDLQDKTVLLATHGFALRCLLQQVYTDGVFWHGKVPDNCAVNIISVENGKSTLIGDDVIYYDPKLSFNIYKPV